MDNPESFADQESLRHYTYLDNRAGGEVIFECEAGDILEADKLYEAATGHDPAKQNYIGCTIENIDK